MGWDLGTLLRRIHLTADRPVLQSRCEFPRSPLRTCFCPYPSPLEATASLPRARRSRGGSSSTAMAGDLLHCLALGCSASTRTSSTANSTATSTYRFLSCSSLWPSLKCFHSSWLNRSRHSPQSPYWSHWRRRWSCCVMELGCRATTCLRRGRSEWASRCARKRARGFGLRVLRRPLLLSAFGTRKSRRRTQRASKADRAASMTRNASASCDADGSRARYADAIAASDASPLRLLRRSWSKKAPPQSSPTRRGRDRSVFIRLIKWLEYPNFTTKVLKNY